MKTTAFSIITALSCALISFNCNAQSIPENHYFYSNGTRIRYIEQGTGEPIIAIHGFTGRSDLFLERFSYLTENYRVIAFDQRGHGLSDKPHSVSGYGRNMGYDIINLMDHLNIPKAHIFGYSLGVDPIPMVITEYESRFISAVFGGGGARWEWGEDLDRLYQERYEELMNMTPEEQKARGAEDQDLIALANLRLAQKQMVVPKQSLANLTIPVLAIVGSEDPALEEVRNFKDTFPFVELIVIEDATHSSARLRPEFRQGIEEFLSRNRQK